MSATTTSPSLSPYFGALGHRRLSARRGSQSASDPFGTHAELNHHRGRSLSSRLTIVRLIDPPADDPHAHAPPAAAASTAGTPGSPVHRRHSLQHHRRAGSGSGGGNGGGGGAPEGSPRLSFANATFARPGSPTSSRPRSPGAHRPSISAPKTRIAPEEIVRLAREANNPHYVPPSSASARGSVGNSPLASPVIGPHATIPPAEKYAPASFTPLDDSMWLPFVDRPAEVTALITSYPTARLFALLAQTLQAPSDAELCARPTAEDDSTAWTYKQLDQWLRDVDRAEADDFLWVRKARACVLAHSELIWERIKGALGVPPELDTCEERPAPEPALYRGDDSAFESEPEDNMLVPSLSLRKPSMETQEIEAEAQVEVEEPEEMYDENAISIEPVVAPSSPPMSAPVTESASGLGDIGEEDEEEEEDTPAGSAAALSPPEPKEDVIQGLRICTVPQRVDEPHYAGSVGAPSPFALGASASPAAAASGPGKSPTVSVFHLDGPSPGTTAPASAPRQGSVTGSPAASAYGGSSAGVVPGAGWPAARARTYSNSSHGSIGGASSGYFDAVSERGPGNPLFPSSFAQLAIAPTLNVNNRSPMPPAPLYGNNPHAIRGQLQPKRRLPVGSWAEGYDPTKVSEYALTTASGTSIHGGD